MAEAAAQKDRRGALVRAAYNQIAERGFEGLRTREVAGEAGVNIATLHYYFPTKEKLIEGVVEHELDSDEVAAMVVATLRNLTLPVASSGARGDQALRQLERWLGVEASARGSARKHSSN